MSFKSQRGAFPSTRMRRLRAAKFSRDLVRESALSTADLIYPVFVIEGKEKRESVPSMPGIERLSIDLLVKLAREVRELEIPAIALFPVVQEDKKSLDSKTEGDKQARNGYTGDITNRFDVSYHISCFPKI